MEIKVNVTKADIRKAISARQREIQKNLTKSDLVRYCPIAQSLTRKGFIVRGVEYQEVRLEGHRKSFALNFPGIRVTYRQPSRWDELLKETPLEVTLTN